MPYEFTGSRIFRTSVVLLLAIPGSALVTSSAWGQQQTEQSQGPQPPQHPQCDPSAIFLTHVPHLNAAVHRGHEVVAGGPAAALTFATAGFGGNPYNVGPTVTPTTTLPEGEEEIAVFPSSASHLVAAVSDFSQNGGFNMTKYVISTDNGTTWTENFVPTDPLFGFLETGDGFFWLANSDPVVAIDKSGYVYMADLYLDVFDNGNGFYVNIIPPGSNVVTVANTLPVKTNPDGSTIQFEDKPWITVDTSNTPTAGTVYASWSHFTNINAGTDYIAFSRSTNHGRTWSSLLRVSLRSQDGAVQGSAVAVGPDGAVYVVYEVFYTGNRRQHFLAKSTNGGISFTVPVAITPVFTDLTFNSTYRKNSFAALSVNPVTGYLYVLYCDQPGADAQVEFIRSTAPGGTTFTGPVVINDNASGQRLMPAIALDNAGTIHTSWFDTRNSPTTPAVLDIYATFSKDNGATFAPNARVTAFSFDAGSASFIGDYSGNAAAGGNAHPVWTNGGFNNGQLQTAVLKVQ